MNGSTSRSRGCWTASRSKAAGLSPIKVNMVVRRGVNESSVVPMAQWAREIGVTLRLIEYMDVGHSNGWRLDDVVPAADLLEAVTSDWPADPAEPATAARSRAAIATATGRRVRDHLLRDDAVLSDARAPGCRPTGSCTHACSR